MPALPLSFGGSKGLPHSVEEEAQTGADAGNAWKGSCDDRYEIDNLERDNST